MNKQTLTFILSLTLIISVFSQNISHNKTNSIPNEKIFVHYNTTFLLPGEYQSYKVYCLNSNTNTLSNLSKIAYVELVSSNKESVFKEKIILKNGVGDGYFFIPPTIKSGSYKLIAYTLWMRNSKKEFFFQGDVSVVNPYLISEEIISKEQDSILSKKNIPYTANIKSCNNFIELKVNQNSFAKREKVLLKINHLINDFKNGNYSISVRKIDKIKTAQKPSATNYDSLNPTNNSVLQSNSKNIYLPELRGELLSGKVINKKTEKTIINKKVALSIPGKDFIFKVSNTNNDGVFYFNLDKEYEGQDAIFQVIGKEREEYQVEIDNQSPLDFPDLKFYDFKITKSSKELILQHSVYNQIENSYATAKSDSIKKIEFTSPFYDSKSIEYFLNDYNRFPTLEETIVEIIPEIFIRTRKGDSTLHVRVYDEEIETGLSSLVLVDGTMVQDHNKLVEYNAKRVNKIEVVNELYLYGSQVFEGVISIETLEGNFKNNISGGFIKNVKLFKPLSKKIYYKQNYDGEDKSRRIPDYRIQLLWESNVVLNEKENKISFFTSDVSGDFEICLEGFTNKGQPVSLRETIIVE
ncbi:MAG: hypothetical protein ABFR05_09065 [Bacteroidota bacterium]